jgi:hypothetical protein
MDILIYDIYDQVWQEVQAMKEEERRKRSARSEAAAAAEEEEEEEEEEKEEEDQGAAVAGEQGEEGGQSHTAHRRVAAAAVGQKRNKKRKTVPAGRATAGSLEAQTRERDAAGSAGSFAFHQVEAFADPVLLTYDYAGLGVEEQTEQAIHHGNPVTGAVQLEINEEKVRARSPADSSRLPSLIEGHVLASPSQPYIVTGASSDMACAIRILSPEGYGSGVSSTVRGHPMLFASPPQDKAKADQAVTRLMEVLRNADFSVAHTAASFAASLAQEQQEKSLYCDTRHKEMWLERHAPVSYTDGLTHKRKKQRERESVASITNNLSNIAMIVSCPILCRGMR